MSTFRVQLVAHTILGLTVLVACSGAHDETAASIQPNSSTTNSAEESLAINEAPSSHSTGPTFPTVSTDAPTSPSTSNQQTTTTTTATTTTSATTTTTTTSAAASGCLDELSLRERIALLLWPAVYTNDWDLARLVVRDFGVGGVLLMRPSGIDESRLTELIAELDVLSELGVLVATDEEGGDVQRLRNYRPLPSQFEVSSTLTVDEARTLIVEHGRFVASIGVDIVLGPVVDVLPPVGDPPLQASRFFAGGPEDVAGYAQAYVDGWRASGLGIALKHFPGHGRASGDTHVVDGFTPALPELEMSDLIPYRRLADPGLAVMIGHLTVPGLTDGLPASISPPAIEFLRGSVGFGEALVISDALDMRAVGLSVPDAAVESIAAGVDVVLFTNPGQTVAVIDTIETAVKSGNLSQERVDTSAVRVLRELESRGLGCAGP